MAKATTAAAPINPFKIAKTKAPAKKGLDHVTPTDELVKAAVDEYKRISAEMKNLEGQLSGHKSVVETYAKSTFAQRHVKGVMGNFNIDGNTDTVQFQAQNRNAGLAEDDYNAFVAEHGEAAAEALLQPNMAAVKFNFDTLKEDGVMDKLVAALNAKDAKGNPLLSEDLLGRLFHGTSYGVTENVFEKARQFAKKPEEFETLMTDLRVTRFLKG